MFGMQKSGDKRSVSFDNWCAKILAVPVTEKPVSVDLPKYLKNYLTDQNIDYKMVWESLSARETESIHSEAIFDAISGNQRNVSLHISSNELAGDLKVILPAAVTLPAAPPSVRWPLTATSLTISGGAFGSIIFDGMPHKLTLAGCHIGSLEFPSGINR